MNRQVFELPTQLKMSLQIRVRHCEESSKSNDNVSWSCSFTPDLDESSEPDFMSETVRRVREQPISQGKLIFQPLIQPIVKNVREHCKEEKV